MAITFPGSPTNGQTFNPGAGLPTWMWDGSKWSNATTPPLLISGLTDVALSSPLNGQPLTYSSSASKWVNLSQIGPNGTGVGYLSWNTDGNFTFNPCSSGPTLNVHGGPGSWAENIYSSGPGGTFTHGYGLQVWGATQNSGEYLVVVKDGSGNWLFDLNADGGGRIGPPNNAMTFGGGFGQYGLFQIAPTQLWGNGWTMNISTPGGPGAIALKLSGPPTAVNGDTLVIQAGASPTLGHALSIVDSTWSINFCIIDNAGRTYFPRVTNTAGNYNVQMIGSSGELVITGVSALKYKKDVETLPRSRARETIEKLRTVSFHSRCMVDDPNQTFYGLVAEEVAEIDPNLVLFDKDGKPDGISYERVFMMLLPVMQELLEERGHG